MKSKREPSVFIQGLRPTAIAPLRREERRNNLLELVGHTHGGVERQLSHGERVACHVEWKPQHIKRMRRVTIGVEWIRLIYLEVFIYGNGVAYGFTEGGSQDIRLLPGLPNGIFKKRTAQFRFVL